MIALLSQPISCSIRPSNFSQTLPSRVRQMFPPHKRPFSTKIRARRWQSTISSAAASFITTVWEQHAWPHHKGAVPATVPNMTIDKVVRFELATDGI